MDYGIRRRVKPSLADALHHAPLAPKAPLCAQQCREGHEPEKMHQLMAHTLDTIIADIASIQNDARAGRFTELPAWPMIILRTPKGWTGPKVVDGKPVEGTWRAHQVPVTDLAKPGHLKILEDWMKSYRPNELFDPQGKLVPELRELAPRGNRRMGANPHANGGILLKDLVMPDFRDYAVKVQKPGTYPLEFHWDAPEPFQIGELVVTP